MIEQPEDSRPPVPSPPSPEPETEGVLDIELEAEEEPFPPVAPAADAEVLEITLDDLEDEPADGPFPAVSEFPALTAQQAQEAEPGVTVPCVCSATRQHFDLRFQEGEPGVFWATETLKTGPKDAKGGGFGGQNEVAGNFRMGPDYACPYCGNESLTLCEACATVLCLGGMDKSGDCACPGCTAVLTPTGGLATSAPARGGKGKKGKG